MGSKISRLSLPNAPIWIEKIEGRGEDAPPLVLAAPDGATIIGVFDGLGGAGAGRVHGADGGFETEARCAAERACDVTRAYFGGFGREEADPPPQDAGETARALKARLQSEFDLLNKTVEREATAIRSSMKRNLPTTCCVLRILAQPQGVLAQAFWAGDSRAYGVTAAGDLICLTEDDVDCGSPIGALAYYAENGDAPMNNCISASREFDIRHAEHHDEFIALIVCSDGAFGSFPNHFLFEAAVLRLLAGALGAEDFEALIRKGRQDDVSFVLLSREPDADEAAALRAKAAKAQACGEERDVAGLSPGHALRSFPFLRAKAGADQARTRASASRHPAFEPAPSARSGSAASKSAEAGFRSPRAPSQKKTRGRVAEIARRLAGIPPRRLALAAGSAVLLALSAAAFLTRATQAPSPIPVAQRIASAPRLYDAPGAPKLPGSGERPPQAAAMPTACGPYPYLQGTLARRWSERWPASSD